MIEGKNATKLTEAQLKRFQSSFNKIIAEHHSEIPDIIRRSTTTTPAPEDNGFLTNVITDAASLVGQAGESVGSMFSGVGQGIQRTLTSLIFLVVVVLVIYFLIRRLPRCKERSRRRSCVRHSFSKPSACAKCEKCAQRKESV